MKRNFARSTFPHRMGLGIASLSVTRKSKHPLVEGYPLAWSCANLTWTGNRVTEPTHFREQFHNTYLVMAVFDGIDRVPFHRLVRMTKSKIRDRNR